MAKTKALTTPKKKPLDLYLTEYGYLRQGKKATPEATRAKYLVQAFKIAQKNKRVKQMLNYLLIEPSTSLFFDTSLILKDGTRTPSFSALASWASTAASKKQIKSPGAVDPAATSGSGTGTGSGDGGGNNGGGTGAPGSGGGSGGGGGGGADRPGRRPNRSAPRSRTCARHRRPPDDPARGVRRPRRPRAPHGAAGRADRDLRRQDTESGTKPTAADTPVFLVARLGDEPVGCGALRPYGDGRIELKRMYVRPAYRGRGLSRAILAALEDEARAEGATTVILETGDRQAEAIALYERHGYESIPKYGPYVDSPISLCYEKRL